ncbi:DUF2877 domain-containing protein [Antricoccus suffuscus]|nr:DUF2877 domain-containing protein [Antricoccus suffuscus]
MAKTMQTSLRCAAPERTRPLWESAVQPLRVVMSFRYAIYLETEAGEPLALCTRDAAAMPFSAVLPVTSDDVTMPARVSDARIGDGILTLGHVTVRPGRYTRSPAPPSSLTPPFLTRYAALGAQTAPLLDLPASALRLCAASIEDPSLLRYLVGLGTGLTPTADDVLAGVLGALHSFRHDAFGTFGAQVAALTARTTWLSARLLEAAAAGAHSAPTLALLTRVSDDDAAWARTVHEVLLHGHTSGAGLAYGVALGAHASSSLIHLNQGDAA